MPKRGNENSLEFIAKKLRKLEKVVKRSRREKPHGFRLSSSSSSSPSRSSSSEDSRESSPTPTDNPEDQNKATYKELDEGEDDSEFEVAMIDESRYTSNLQVSKHYFGSIIGKKGATKSRIEQDTRTEIKIPNHGQNGDIIIFGPSAANVKAARRRISMIVMSTRMKQPVTHFISIPLNESAIMQRFESFKESVLRDCPSRGLDESLFIRAEKLHLTLGVMCLMDSDERLFASKLLNEAKEKVINPLLQGNLPLRIRIQGVSYMNDNPREINVLYARVAEPGLLQRLADELVEYFYKEGYMKKTHGRESVKLHVTLINSRYGLRSSAQDVRLVRQTRETFDGSQILQKYADYDFGTIEFKHLHLSQMSKRMTGSDGYYHATCVISLGGI